METDLHGKWLINAGAWIIVRCLFPPIENVCVFTVCHTNSIPRDSCFCALATSALYWGCGWHPCVHFRGSLLWQTIMCSRNSCWEGVGATLLFQCGRLRGFRFSELQKGYCFHFPWPLKEDSQFSIAAKFQTLQRYKPKEENCSSTCLSKGENVVMLLPPEKEAANGKCSLLRTCCIYKC